MLKEQEDILLRILLNYIIGYYNVQIDGFYIEKFINICMKENIFLWGIKRKKSSIILAKIGMEDYKLAKEIASKNQTIIEVKSRVGIKFSIEKYKNRKAFFITVAVMCIFIYSLSKFVWKIEITGTQNISEEEILSEIKENGIRVGTLKSKIDTDKIVNDIRLKRDDIAWIGIEISGTKVNVKIVEATKKPEIIDENEYTNIVATKDGEIQKVVAQNGTVMCKKGDKVKKGDILIAGYMEGNYTDRYYVNSSGEVLAKINYMESVKIMKKETKKEDTGKKKIKFAIKFNNFKINFFKKLSNFENYDTIYTSKKIKIFSNSNLQIEFIKYDISEVKIDEVIHSVDEAKTIGEAMAKQKLDEKIDGEIINQETRITEFDSYYVIDVQYDVIESIGTKEKIDF